MTDEAALLWFDRVMETVNRTTGNLYLLTIQEGRRDSRLDELEAKLDRLIDALLRSRNGDQSGQT